MIEIIPGDPASFMLGWKTRKGPCREKCSETFPKTKVTNSIFQVNFQFQDIKET